MVLQIRGVPKEWKALAFTCHDLHAFHSVVERFQNRLIYANEMVNIYKLYLRITERERCLTFLEKRKRKRTILLLQRVVSTYFSKETKNIIN